MKNVLPELPPLLKWFASPKSSFARRPASPLFSSAFGWCGWCQMAAALAPHATFQVSYLAAC
eukprot:2504916-Karenia_brevis.AAC.1